MRKDYISPEFRKVPVYGTYNMLEESNFFGAKMLEIEDSITIEKQSIIYYQRQNGEQKDINTESNLPSVIYNASDSMKSNHTISLDQKQNQYSMDNSTRWIFDIKIQSCLSEIIFAKIKNYRTFEGVRPEWTISNDVNASVKRYVDVNVLNRYKFAKLDLYIKYVDLNGQNVLRYNNKWNPEILDEQYLYNKYDTTIDFEEKNLRIAFNQIQPSSKYRFDYFFTLKFDKI
jgi:hypothetical protein